MNTLLVTGYLLKPSWRAHSSGHNGGPKLIWDVMLQAQGDAEATSWRCEVDLLTLGTDRLDVIEPKLVPGAAVIIQGELAGRPYVDKHGIRQWDSRFIKVVAVEFSRVANVKPPEAEAAG